MFKLEHLSGGLFPAAQEVTSFMLIVCLEESREGVDTNKQRRPPAEMKEEGEERNTTTAEGGDKIEKRIDYFPVYYLSQLRVGLCEARL